MAKHLNILNIFIVDTILLLGTSCSKTHIIGQSDLQAAFLTTTEGVNGIATKGNTTLLEEEISGNMVCSVEESDWNVMFEEFSTKSEVTGDEIEWQDNPGLGIYLTSSDDENLIARNLAMNPITHAMLENFYQDEKGTIVSSSNSFWNTNWSWQNNMTNKVNFYGYYPRPHDTKGGLEYQKTSIIRLEDATGQDKNEWNMLHYEFVDQIDENMSWHDLMYSIPEDEGVRYGNKNKKKGDNVQMHFVHAFSLLDIEINRGDTYKGDCEITSIVLSGTQVFSEGTLDILNGKISPERGAGSQIVKLKRDISPTKITKKTPFNTTLIVQPTQDGDNPNSEGRLVITCDIDGVNYTCDFPTLKLIGGKRYKLKLTLTPAGIVVFKIWNGAHVKIGDKEYGPGDSEQEMTFESYITDFSVQTDNGYTLVDVLENKRTIKNENNIYPLTKSDDSNTYYNIVAVPADKWYVTNQQQMHLDGIENRYNGDGKNQDKELGTWYDLSGNDNDGTLRAFATPSGWDGKGLNFDGLNDIVYFSGQINPSYTMEMYVCVEPEQIGAHPRFTAEGPNYPCFYFYGTSSHYDGKYISTSNSRDLAFYDEKNEGLRDQNKKDYEFEVKQGWITTDGTSIIQLDFTYDSNEKKLTWYINGEYCGYKKGRTDPKSVTTASIGSRIKDNTRAMAVTYYSFIIYKKALTADEVKKNYEVNVYRYGKTRK